MILLVLALVILATAALVNSSQGDLRVRLIAAALALLVLRTLLSSFPTGEWF